MMCRLRHRRFSPIARRAFTLMEALAACAVLGVSALLTVQMLSALSRDRRSSERRELALREADNMLERLTLSEWDELSEQAVSQIELSAAAKAQLPAAELKVTVTTPAEEPNAKQLVVSLRWHSANGDYDAPLRLSAWVYRDAGN